MNGIEIYRGPSLIDGKSIAVLLTFRSANTKTGNMMQTWIMPANIAPNQATKTGEDSSVCGSCPLRPAAARSARKKAPKGGPRPSTCYVNVRAPLNVFKSMLRGGYPPGSLDTLAGVLPIRAGAWGDPGAVPFSVWRPLRGRRHTGYVRRWRELSASPDPWAALFMASCHTPEEREDARAAGWRTFRVRRWIAGKPEALLPGEIVCPASREFKATNPEEKISCATCSLCDGKKGEADRRADIAIIDHGPGTRRRHSNTNLNHNPECDEDIEIKKMEVKP